MADQPAGPSVTTTTAGVMSAATVAPIVQWALLGFHGTPPDGTALAIAAGVVVVAHYAQTIIAAWLAKKGLPIEAPPSPQ